MDFLKRLFSPAKQNTSHTSEPRFRLGGTFYYEFDEVSNGYGGYRPINLCLRRTDDAAFCRCIVNRTGHICGFPGVKKGAWTKDVQYPYHGVVRFGFRISVFRDGKAKVSWTPQPDGRYFEDEDGFGAENCEEITLYSYLDEDGRFTEPFVCNE